MRNNTVDAAWEELEAIRVFPITESQLRKLGKDPEVSVRFPPEYGLGEDAYMAQLDMFHQIHCLSLLRMQAWKDFDHEATLRRTPYRPMHWAHLSHCIDTLMKNLMCTASLDIVTFVWLELQEAPWPDFNVAHKCRSYDDVRKWQEEHAVPKDWGRNFSRPKDFVELPLPEGWYRIHNYTHEGVAAKLAQGLPL